MASSNTSSAMKRLYNQSQRALMRAQAHGILGSRMNADADTMGISGPSAPRVTEEERQMHVEGRLWDELSKLQGIPVEKRTNAQKKRLQNLNTAVTKEAEHSVHLLLANPDQANMNSRRRRNTRKRKSRRATTRRNRSNRK